MPLIICKARACSLSYVLHDQGVPTWFHRGPRGVGEGCRGLDTPNQPGMRPNYGLKKGRWYLTLMSPLTPPRVPVMVVAKVGLFWLFLTLAFKVLSEAFTTFVAWKYQEVLGWTPKSDPIGLHDTFQGNIG